MAPLEGFGGIVGETFVCGPRNERVLINKTDRSGDSLIAGMGVF